MNYIPYLTFALGLYIGSNIPKAWNIWKTGTAQIREIYKKKAEVKDGI